jgi:hypothetical protein
VRLNGVKEAGPKVQRACLSASKETGGRLVGEQWWFIVQERFKRLALESFRPRRDGCGESTVADAYADELESVLGIVP